METEKIKIVYLYAEIMSYNVAVFKEYVTHHNAEVHVVHWDIQKKTPYVAPVIEGVSYYGKSQFDKKTLPEFVNNLQPDIIFTSGWMDKLYIRTCKNLRKKQIPVVAVSDTQYYNTVRQNLGLLYFKLFYKKAFTHLWVAGAYQYEYAKMLGYKNSEIIFNFLSADLSIFNSIYKNTIEYKTAKYPHQFLFAGRFAHEKGLDLLLEAWSSIKNKKDWTLALVGSGPLREHLAISDDIIIHDFVQPEHFQELVAQSGCFVLPSRMEPWALVLHEFSAAGMPIVTSDACGAAPTFLVSGYNGYAFQSGTLKALQDSMQFIIDKSDDELVLFSKRSHKLGQRIDPETIAANSLSIL